MNHDIYSADMNSFKTKHTLLSLLMLTSALTVTIDTIASTTNTASVIALFLSTDDSDVVTVNSIEKLKSLESGTDVCVFLTSEMNARVLYTHDDEVYLRDNTGAICLMMPDSLFNPKPSHNQHVAGYMTGRLIVLDNGLPVFFATSATLTEYMLFAEPVSEPATSPEKIDVEEYGAYYSDWVTLTNMNVSVEDNVVTLDYDDQYFTMSNKFGLTESDGYTEPQNGSTIEVSGIALPSSTGNDIIVPANIDTFPPIVVLKEYIPVYGDVNSDGQINISDIVEIIRIISGEPSQYNGDVNGDGQVNITDVVLVVNKIAGVESTNMSSHRKDITETSTITVSPAGPPSDYGIHAMTIYFVNGNTRSFSIDDLSSITYVPDIGMKIHQSTDTICLDYLYSQIEKIDYVYEIEVEPDNNVNANWKDFTLTKGEDGNLTYAYRLEYPHLSSDRYSSTNRNGSQVVVKETSQYGITFSLEWDNGKIANRWTCYTMHAGNTLQNTKRKDSFKSDPDVAVSSELGDYSSSGFSRGHLCPSADRLCSSEQNSQTFFLTNMQPQWQNHNGVLWANLEGKIRDWSDSCDTLYVVKAATIDDVVLNGKVSDGVYSYKCNNRLPVPKYFYMALLSYKKSTNSYEAMGLWTIHQNSSDNNKNYGDYAITIEELERRTGIDFFCNLPDDIEKAVEGKLNLSYWGLK